MSQPPLQDEARPFVACTGCHEIRPAGQECACQALKTALTERTARALLETDQAPTCPLDAGCQAWRAGVGCRRHWPDQDLHFGCDHCPLGNCPDGAVEDGWHCPCTWAQLARPEQSARVTQLAALGQLELW